KGIRHRLLWRPEIYRLGRRRAGLEGRKSERIGCGQRSAASGRCGTGDARRNSDYRRLIRQGLLIPANGARLEAPCQPVTETKRASAARENARSAGGSVPARPEKRPRQKQLRKAGFQPAQITNAGQVNPQSRCLVRYFIATM